MRIRDVVVEGRGEAPEGFEKWSFSPERIEGLPLFHNVVWMGMSFIPLWFGIKTKSLSLYNNSVFVPFPSAFQGNINFIRKRVNPTFDPPNWLLYRLIYELRVLTAEIIHSSLTQNKNRLLEATVNFYTRWFILSEAHALMDNPSDPRILEVMDLLVPLGVGLNQVIYSAGAGRIWGPARKDPDLLEERREFLRETENLLFYYNLFELADNIHLFFDGYYSVGKTFLEKDPVYGLEDMLNVSYIEISMPRDPWQDFLLNNTAGLHLMGGDPLEYYLEVARRVGVAMFTPRLLADMYPRLSANILLVQGRVVDDGDMGKG